MTPLIGKDFMLYGNVAGVLKPVICATTMTISFSADMREATKKTDGKFKSYYPGMIGYSIQLEGVYNLIEATDSAISAKELLQLLMSGEELLWVAQDVNHNEVNYSGSVLSSSLSITSPADGHHTFSSTLTGTGEIVL